MYPHPSLMARQFEEAQLVSTQTFSTSAGGTGTLTIPSSGAQAGDLGVIVGNISMSGGAGAWTALASIDTQYRVLASGDIGVALTGSGVSQPALLLVLRGAVSLASRYSAGGVSTNPLNLTGFTRASNHAGVLVTEYDTTTPTLTFPTGWQTFSNLVGSTQVIAGRLPSAYVSGAAVSVANPSSSGVGSIALLEILR